MYCEIYSQNGSRKTNWEFLVGSSQVEDGRALPYFQAFLELKIWSLQLPGPTIMPTTHCHAFPNIMDYHPSGSSRMGSLSFLLLLLYMPTISCQVSMLQWSSKNYSGTTNTDKLSSIKTKPNQPRIIVKCPSMSHDGTLYCDLDSEHMTESIFTVPAHTSDIVYYIFM